MKLYTLPLIALLFASSPSVPADESNPLRLYDLKVEHMENPIQLDIHQPRLSWKIKTNDPDAKKVEQTAYHILVASTPEMLADNKADLWDTGLVASSQSILIPYEGKKPASRQACYWKVQVADNQGHTSGWSDVASWEMALLEPKEWAGSEWIGLKNDTRDSEFAERMHTGSKKRLRSHPSPLLRKEIALKKDVRKARAYVSGIGYSELYINGKKIGDHVLDPGQTNYEKHTLYVVHDITDALKPGTNALGFWLGNGFYGQNIGFAGKFGYGPPSVRAKLFVEYADGSNVEFVTDTSWKATVSPIVFDNVYWGESYDARLEMSDWASPGFDDSKWQVAVNVEAPCQDNNLRPQLLPPIKEMGRIKPVSVREVEKGTYLLDFGKNLAGWFDIRLTDQKKGDVIRFFSAEVLNKETGRADQVTWGGAPGGVNEQFYICKGAGPESYSPRFTYCGFQYLEISGLSKAPDADSIEAVMVHSAIEKTGDFSASNEMLNKQYAASLLSLEDNWHSFPEDCPNREKCGWLGDAHATAGLSLYNYDMARFYNKYVRDIQDSLNKDQKVKRVLPDSAGIPPQVAPGKRCNNVAQIDWAVAYIIIPWQMYLHTGDAEAFRPHYEHFKDFITYYKSFKNNDGVIDNGLGDWCPPNWDRRRAPEFMECHPYVSGTAFYYEALQIISEMAVLMNDEQYGTWCKDEAASIQKAFDKTYLKPIEGSSLKHYGSQTATVMALNLGMVPEDQIKARVDGLLYDINKRHDGHHACGIHGLRHLYTVLADNGQDELVYKMLNDTTFPGPGYIMNLGLTTWPERRFEWDKVRYSNSFNHPMNGGFAAFMHESLGGIRPDASAPGYKHFQLKPHLTEQLEWVKTSVESPYGTIRSEWKNDGKRFIWEVEVPVNTTATLFIPYSSGKEVSENTRRGLQKRLPLVDQAKQQWLQCEVGSGTYTFMAE